MCFFLFFCKTNILEKLGFFCITLKNTDLLFSFDIYTLIDFTILWVFVATVLESTNVSVHKYLMHKTPKKNFAKNCTTTTTEG